MIILNLKSVLKRKIVVHLSDIYLGENNLLGIKVLNILVDIKPDFIF